MTALLPSWIWLVLTGVAAGVASGMFGIGGGVIIVPILVYLFGYSQITASGTSLVALLLPVGIFAVWNYWREQRINADNVSAGLMIGLGIALGALIGSQIAISLSQETLKRCFSVFLVIIAVKMWLG